MVDFGRRFLKHILETILLYYILIRILLVNIDKSIFV